MCEGKECGDDGCGGTCGECNLPDGAACATAPKCVDGACDYDVQPYYCLVGGICIPSGTENPDNPCEKCQPTQGQTSWSKVEDGMTCAVGLTCHNGKCCSYDCAGKVCGDDGCGGQCGSCGAGEVCCDGQFCGECCDSNDVDWDGCTDGKITEFGADVFLDPNCRWPRVESNSNGTFLVTWTAACCGYFNKVVRARVFGPDGQPLVGTFTVQTNTKGWAMSTSVGVQEKGWFVVAWMEDYSGTQGSENSTKFHAINDAGMLIGGESVVASGYVGPSTAVCGLASGGFVVLHPFAPNNPNYQGLFATGYGDDLQATWGDKSVGGIPTWYLAAAPLSDGGFVTTSRLAEYTAQLHRVDGKGNLLIPAVAIPGFKLVPAIASLPSDELVVLAATADSVTALALDSALVLKGSHVLLAQASHPYEVGLARLADSSLMAVWGGSSVQVQRLDASGQPMGLPVQVNSHEDPNLRDPDIAALPDGGFVVVWGDCAQNEDSNCTIFAQRFDADMKKLYH